MRNLVKALPHIKAAIDADCTGYLECSFLADYENVLGWALNHHDHELIMENEYSEHEAL